MIDIETLVFNKVATALRSEYSGISVYGEYVESPKSFPCVCFYEDDNYPYSRTKTVDEAENHANVRYVLYVNTNKESGKKAEARAIVKSVDNVLKQYNFEKMAQTPIPDVDRTIYRITARYRAVVEKPTADGTYYIYRK